MPTYKGLNALNRIKRAAMPKIKTGRRKPRISIAKKGRPTGRRRY